MPQQPQKGNRQKDPRQQQLRSNKKNWSAEVSALISKIIAFKRAVNGRGDTSIGVKPSSIKDPLPAEVGGVLQQLSQEFGKVVSDAEAIIAEQQNYSATRRKRQPKKPKPATPQQPAAPAQEAQQANPAPTEANPLARLGAFDASMEKFASNKLTRFWAYLSSVFSRQEFKRQRLGMLSLSADLFYNFLDFENDILKLGEKNIPAVINKFQNMRNTFTGLKKSFEEVAMTLAERAKKEGINPPPPAQPPLQSNPTVENNEETEDNEDETNETTDDIHVDQIQHNLNKYKNTVPPKQLSEIMSMINAFNNETDQHAKSLWLEQIKVEYNNLSKYIASGKKTANIKVAHNAITRFLRKQLVKALPSDKTASPRLQAVDIAIAAKQNAKRLMDVLEKDLSVDEVSILLAKIEKQISDIERLVMILMVLYKERFSGENNEGFKDLNQALRRKVRRDLLKDIM